MPPPGLPPPTFHRRLGRSWLCDNIAPCIQLQLAPQELGGGLAANGKEQARHVQRADVARGQVTQANTLCTGVEGV